MAIEPPDLLYVPALTPEHEALLQQLCGEIEWDQRMRARKTASFGAPYNYSGMSYPEVPIPPAIEVVRQAVAARVGFEPNNCLVNYYEHGRSRMGFHFDGLDELEPGTGVAIVSLGATRTLWFRDIDDKRREVARPLAGGSLLYMPPEVQHRWKHGIPREPGVGPRISLTFRRLREGG